MLALVGADRATGFIVVYGLDAKTSIFDAFEKHDTFLKSLNKAWRQLVFDMGSMVRSLRSN